MDIWNTKVRENLSFVFQPLLKGIQNLGNKPLVWDEAPVKDKGF